MHTHKPHSCSDGSRNCLGIELVFHPALTTCGREERMGGLRAEEGNFRWEWVWASESTIFTEGISGLWQRGTHLGNIAWRALMPACPVHLSICLARNLVRRGQSRETQMPGTSPRVQGAHGREEETRAVVQVVESKSSSSLQGEPWFSWDRWQSELRAATSEMEAFPSTGGRWLARREVEPAHKTHNWTIKWRSNVGHHGLSEWPSAPFGSWSV